MLSRYFQDDNFKIHNKVVVYLIVFFILLPISNVYTLSTQDLQLFTNIISKLVLLVLIIVTTITKNYQISLTIAIFYIYVCLFNRNYQENFRSEKKNKFYL